MPAVHERPLDLRTFQDIVDEARKLIPKYCPEWTDHNLSDPGITLIELFAWMTEMILYQMNRVPGEMHERFLDMVGVRRYPPKSAVADVTFYLSAPLRRALTIPADTEVATDRTETQEAIVFSTASPLTIAPPTLVGLRAWREGKGFEDYMPYVTSALIKAPIFNNGPVEGDALYVGYAGNLWGSSLQIRLECQELEASHIDPRDPPLAWEYHSAITNDWERLPLLDRSGTGRPREPDEIDPTHGLNRSGDVYLHIPADSQPATVDGIEATWIRIRHVEKAGQGYTSSPVVTGLRSETIGGTVPARQAHHVGDEYLDESAGTPDQSFHLRERPVLTQEGPHVISVAKDGVVEEWMEVEDFSASDEGDRHFVIDYLTGEVRFAPEIRGRDGSSRRYGAVPTKGALITLRSYRSGGGTIGNVGEGTITQLKTSIPYVASVTNYRPAGGGLNEETLEEAKHRSLGVLRRAAAAISKEDYERICQEVRGVGRAHCVAAESDNGDLPLGVVRVLLVPALPEPQEALLPEDLPPSPYLIEAVSAHVDERKVLGTLIQYGPVEFTWVEIDAHVYVKPDVDPDRAEVAATQALRTYLHPTRGGPVGSGLRFGARLTESQIIGLLQSVLEVAYVERVRLRTQGDKKDTSRVEAPQHGLLVLGHCYVKADLVEDGPSS